MLYRSNRTLFIVVGLLSVCCVCGCNNSEPDTEGGASPAATTGAAGATAGGQETRGSQTGSQPTKRSAPIAGER